MPEGPSLEIRPPLLGEWPACRMLLPDAFTQGARPEALVAFDQQVRNITGVATFHYAAKEIRAVRIRVVRAHRRKGIGSQFLQRICSLATERGLGEISGYSNITLESDAEAFLLANHFRRDVQVSTVEGNLLLLLDRLRGVCRRLTNAGKVPLGIRFVGLEEAPHDQLAKIYADQIAEARNFHPSYMLPVLADARLAASTVLMVDGTVRGMLLCEGNDGKNVATVHARAVSPGYRGGWANCLLMLRSAEQAWQAGSGRVRFDVPGDNSDTLKLMTRCNAEIKHVLCWFIRDVRPQEVVSA